MFVKTTNVKSQGQLRPYRQSQLSTYSADLDLYITAAMVTKFMWVLHHCYVFSVALRTCISPLQSPYCRERQHIFINADLIVLLLYCPPFMYMNQLSGVHEHQHEKHTASIQSNVAPASREIPKEVA